MRNRPCWNLKRGSSGNGAPDELGGIRSLAAARAAEVARGLALCRVVDRSPAGTSARSLPRETSGLIRTTLIRHQYLHTEQGHEKHHQFGHEAFGQRSRSDGTHSGFRVDFPLFHANVPSVLDLASGLSSGGLQCGIAFMGLVAGHDSLQRVPIDDSYPAATEIDPTFRLPVLQVLVDNLPG